MEDRGQSTQLLDVNTTGKNRAVNKTLRDPLSHPFPCCNKLFWKKRLLHQYLKSLHPEVIKKPHQCDACPKAFEYPSMLKRKTFYVRYVPSHDKPHKCPKCDYDCKTESDLNKHLKTHNRNPEIFKCSRCEKDNLTKGDLYRHWKEAHVCLNREGNAESDNSQSNNEEGSVHTPADQRRKQLRPFSCQHCDKSFSTQAGLNRHITVKHPEVTKTPHECHACQRVFPSASLLKRHSEQLHNDDWPYKCRKCTFHCKNEWVFKSHLKIHDRNGEILKCSICDKEYLSISGLNYHLKTAHDSLRSATNTERNNSQDNGFEKESQRKGSRVINEVAQRSFLTDVSKSFENGIGTLDPHTTELQPRSETTENAVPIACWVCFCGSIYFSQEDQKKHWEENHISGGAIEEAVTATGNACGESSERVSFSFISTANEIFTSSNTTPGSSNAQREASGGIAEASPQNISTAVSQGPHNGLLRVDHQPSAGADYTEFSLGD